MHAKSLPDLHVDANSSTGRLKRNGGSCCIRGVVLVLCLAVVGGCDQKAPSGSAAQPYRIALIPPATEDAYWQQVHQAAVLEAQRARITVVWDGPRSRAEAAAQAVILRAQLAQGVDAVAIAPLDPTRVGAVLRDSPRRILVAAIHRTIPGDGVTCTVGVSPRPAGIASGQKMLEILGGIRAHLVAVYGTAPSADAERARAFANWMSAASMDVLAVEGPAGDGSAALSDKLHGIFKQATEDYGGGIHGIFAADPVAARCVANAMRAWSAQWTPQPPLVVAYYPPGDWPETSTAKCIDVVVTPDPQQTGHAVVQGLSRALLGASATRSIDIGVSFTRLAHH